MGRGDHTRRRSRTRSRRRRQRLPIRLNQRIHLSALDARHQVLVVVDDMPGGEQGVGVGPGKGRDVEEALHVLRQFGQHRLQIQGEQAEQVDGLGAHVLLQRIAFQPAQFPGLVLVHELIGAVGQGHHLTQGLAVFARLVQLGDGGGGSLGIAQQRAVHRRQPAVEALGDEAGATAGDVDVLAHQVGVHPGDEVVQAQVDVLHGVVELGGIVVAQPLRIEPLLEIALGGDESAARLGHLLPVHRQEAVGEDPGGGTVARVVQHGRPEQGVEVEDVLADEVVQLRVRAPLGVGRHIDGGRARRQVAETAEVADGRVQPDVEELSRGAGDLEAEVGRVAGDVPVRQLVVALGSQPFLHLVGRLGLQRRLGRELARGPAAQEVLAARVGQLEEVMLRGLAHGRGARHGGIGVLQLGGGVGGAAHLAGVPVLVLGGATGALALDVAVRQEHLLDRVVELLDGAHLDQPRRPQLGVDIVGVEAGFLRVGRVVVVEGHVEAGKVARVLAMDARDQRLGGDALLLRPQHDGRAVGVVGAHVPAFVAAHLLEAHPDVGLDILHQVAEVDGAIGVGQGAGDEDFALQGGRHRGTSC